jgi:hypothetical protein
MITCLKCGTINHNKTTDVSPCPSCGAIYSKVVEHINKHGSLEHNLPKKNYFKIIFSYIRVSYVIGISFVFLIIIGAINAPRVEHVPLTKAELHQKNVISQFSGWDGSNYAMTKRIKSILNDPDSYEHIETRYKDKGTYLAVYSTISAKNAFGGRIKNTFMGIVDMDENVTEFRKI